MSHDLALLPGPDFPPAIQEILDRYYPSRDGEVLSLFRVFARSPRLMKKLGAAGLLDAASPLTVRQREIVILRTTANNDCEYEWGVHVTVFAGAAGFSDAQIRATRLAPAESEGWDEKEQLLLHAVDQLHINGRMDEPTSQRFTACWSTEQQLEILALCGYYKTISMIANTAALPTESWAARFPE
ncbi:carboxymuconolactone decarboxylase family protein [Halopseudomonas laoshanensis]|uniref:Carboxymuconolactone decarboxylase family protein n=1 Tax=Halopseudomonas laoshanensis TaxID=2268758 RepID=A0A7V7GPI2_9GAMM|nr:carboxymuconolactone decarboxylase family protein [Halopseudomonas laoshanensis]KAA0691344.1 carboxymuconolactone decarboxylase family protein [Halopseudomonas laoshanensis]